jgi:hypothetical protein
MAKQKIPQRLLTKNIWEDRYEDIRNIERYLTRNGVVIRKFFLHVSSSEQKKRFLERLEPWVILCAMLRLRLFRHLWQPLCVSSHGCCD